MKKLNELKEIWNIDKTAFSAKEIGGLQAFVKDVLECSDLFNLSQGNESTKNEKRKNEFVIEASKTGGRADFVVFINGLDIIIPVEVERHNNIQKGVEQLYRYQKDWDKKYGILTDGNEWRLYRASQYKSFFIDNIFDNPLDFISYWQFYIKPENYYIELFNPSEEENVFIDKIDLNNHENRIIFFDEITKLISNFKGKMKAIGAFDNLFNLKENEKVAVETSYAYLIQFILYKVLVDNEYKRFRAEYSRMLARIQKSIYDEDFYTIIINDIKNISEYISSNIYKPFEQEQKSINSKLIENLKKGNISIDDIAPWLDIIAFINRYNFAGLKNEIFGFIYENYLKDLYQDKNKGQYFTDPAVVNFMLNEIGYTEDELKSRVNNKQISLIDPSCGAGTFLYSSVDRIINAFDNGTEQQSILIQDLVDKNIFGLDIEEFPLYLAEMNILMRLLPLIVNDDYENPIDSKIKIFKTKDSISEFLETGISTMEEEFDLFKHLEKTALDYPSFMRDESDLEEMLQSLRVGNGARDRFDYVIGNPPYIGYNECCRQEIEFTQKIKSKEDKSISMANVYGMNLNTVPGRRKPYSPKPNLYAFFIALGLALLKDNGKLCYIIPQTLLTAGDLDVLRYHLAKNTTIEKIITFEGNLFIGRGLKQNRPVPTSSLILVIKKTQSIDNVINVVNFQNPFYNEDFTLESNFHSKNKCIKNIKQTDLLNNVSNWNFIKKSKMFLDSISSYISNSLSIEKYRSNVLSHYDEITIDGGLKLDSNFISNVYSTNSYLVFNPKINNYKQYRITSPDLYYPKSAPISYIAGSQGFKAFNNKYRIIWKTRFKSLFQYSDCDDLILNSNQSLLISSQNKTEIFWLISILNSKLILKFIDAYAKIPNEATYIVAISTIKEFVRIPIINSENKHIKDEIVLQTEYLLSIEDKQLKDYVSFTTSIQKFADLYIEDNELILVTTDNTKISQVITGNPENIQKIIETEKSKGGVLSGKDFALQNIKYLEVIDLREQKKVKDYIDDLVFSMYFNIELREIGIDKADSIKEICRQSQFYDIINS